LLREQPATGKETETGKHQLEPVLALEAEAGFRLLFLTAEASVVLVTFT